MPTIDQLAPATAASDSDEIVVSQSGIARKATRAQVISGLQTELAVTSGYVLGRNSSGTGAPEQIAVGNNLLLSHGTLSATASPYVISQLPAGTVPYPADLISLGQDGTNTAISYLQFMSGLSGLSNIDSSNLMVTPTGSTTAETLAGFAAATLPKAGGSMTGPLSLAGSPVTPLGAATKQYVDNVGVSLACSGAKGDGVTDDTNAINLFLAGFTSGQRILVPEGTFYLIDSGSLAVPPGVVIEGTAPLANQANSALFTGCGFYLNPAYCLNLGYAAQLRNLKILRKGLLANPTSAQVSTAVTTWATEAVSLVTTSGSAVGSNILTFASTAGVVSGMPVFGNGVPLGTTVSNVSAATVTLSHSIEGTEIGGGQGIRFGASIGILILPNLGNNVLEDLQIIGFRTGILAMSGEFYASRIQADCITVLEGTWAGDNAYLRDFHCVPYYAIGTSNSSPDWSWRRPGPAFYLHDQTDGWVLDNFFALHWQVGYQLSNVGSVTLRRCGYERLNDGWTGTTGFLWQGKEASCQCFDGYANGAAVGFDMQQTGEVQMAGMSTVGPIDGTGVAHYRLGTSSWGTICNPMINEAGPTIPVVVQANVNRWKIIAPFIDNGTDAPWITIDPTSIGAVDLFMVRDTANVSPTATETHLHEKVWISTDPSVLTTDGSPQSSLALEATTTGTSVVKHLELLRAGVGIGSLQSVPQGTTQPGFALIAEATNSSIILSPNGSLGAFVLGQVPDSTPTGGNARNGGAVDLQMFRAQASQVASGGYSIVLGGYGNTAAGPWSLVGGSYSVASGQASVSIGFANQISGNNSSAPGGANASDHGRSGLLVWSSDTTAPGGYRQKSVQILGAFSNDAVPTRLTSDSAVAGGANTVNIPDWTLYGLRVVVVARHYEAGDAAVWLLDSLLLHRGSGPGSVVLAGGGTAIAPARYIGAGNSWSISVTGDVVNGGLNVTVTGAAGYPLHWTASVEATEVG